MDTYGDFSKVSPAAVPFRAKLVRHVGSTLSIAVVTLFAAPAFAQQSLDPLFRVTVEGFDVPIEVSVDADQTGKSFRFEGNYADQFIAVRLSGFSNADPFIVWALGATNLTGVPLGFGFTFATPVIGGPYDRVSNGFSGSVTDLAGDGVGAALVSNEVGIVLGVPVPGSLIGGDCLYPGPNAPAFSASCPLAPALQFGPAVNAVPSDFYTFLATEIKFTLSSLDAASFSGAAVLDTVAVIPVPASLPLFGAGLAAGALFWRRRRVP